MKIKRASGKHAAMMGNHFFDELDEVRESIQEAEVLSLLFPYFGKAILLDTRSNGIRAVKYDKLVPLLIEGFKELKEALNMIRNNHNEKL